MCYLLALCFTAFISPLSSVAALEGTAEEPANVCPRRFNYYSVGLFESKSTAKTPPSDVVIPFCEPYVSENDTTFGVEIINLTTAMRLIATHRKNSPVPVSSLTGTSDTESSGKSTEEQNSSISAVLPSPQISSQGGRCIAIYLFARWCSFSAAVAPYISALAKLFSSCCMKFVAVDAALDVSGTTTFFGAGSVPQLIIYRPHRPLVRISPISTDIKLLLELVNNATGFNVTVANISALPTQEDFTDNVLPLGPVREFDPYLVIAWVHTLIALLVIAYKFEYVRNLILSIWQYIRGFGQEIHAHLD